MKRLGRTIAATAAILILAGLLLFGLFGAFSTSEDLDRRAEELDAGVAEADIVAADAATPDGGETEALSGTRSLPVGGKATVILEHFALDDHRGRDVLRVRRLESVLDLDAIKRGVYRVTEGTIEGAHVTLYRDETGRLSLSNALEESPPPVRRGLAMPPAPSGTIGEQADASGDKEPWLLEIGPLHARNVTLTLGFTEKPVVFHVDRARIMVRRRASDTGPVIYLSRVEGRMVKPDPLPKPVLIAHAEGVVRPSGHPLVTLTARTCMGGDELRVKAVVPARKKGVDLTVDSAGFVAALGQMGLKIASRQKGDKLRYQSGAVRLDHGAKCSAKNIADPKPEPAQPWTGQTPNEGHAAPREGALQGSQAPKPSN